MSSSSRFQTGLSISLSLAMLLTASLVNAQPDSRQQSTETEIEDWVTATLCPADDRTVDLEGSVSFTFTDAAGNNLRHLDADQSGLTTAGLSDLQLAWDQPFFTTPLTSAGYLRWTPVAVVPSGFMSPEPVCAPPWPTGKSTDRARWYLVINQAWFTPSMRKMAS